MKYIYKIEEETVQYVTSVFDEVSDDDILKAYNNCTILTDYIKKPYLKNKKIVESVYDFYTIFYNEDGKISSIEDGYIYKSDSSFICTPKTKFNQEDIEYYTVLAGTLKLDNKAKNKALKEEQQQEIEDLKQEMLKLANAYKKKIEDVGFIYKDDLRQPCREQDKTSVTAKVVEIQFTKQPSCEWKFFHKDTDEHIYKNLTLQDLAIIGQKIGVVIINSMKAESKIIEDIKVIENIEDLKAYDVVAKFEEYFKN